MLSEHLPRRVDSGAPRMLHRGEPQESSSRNVSVMWHGLVDLLRTCHLHTCEMSSLLIPNPGQPCSQGSRPKGAPSWMRRTSFGLASVFTWPSWRDVSASVQQLWE